MAEIVILNAWRKSHPQKPRIEIGADKRKGRPLGPADVLIFTGVRYERFDDRLERSMDRNTDRKAENHAVRLEQN